MDSNSVVVYVILALYLCVDMSILFVWLYAKYLAIRSLYSYKYAKKIIKLKSNKWLWPFWKYTMIMRIAFRAILKGKI